MRRAALTALPLLLALCATALSAPAQTIYRCGSHYSQIPCEGAVEVNADDARSAAQKTDSEKAIARDGRTADAMEKARLQEEKKRAAQDALARKAEEKLSKASQASKKKTGKATDTSNTSEKASTTKADKKTDAEPFIAEAKDTTAK